MSFIEGKWHHHEKVGSFPRHGLLHSLKVGNRAHAGENGYLHTIKRIFCIAHRQDRSFST